MNVLRECNGDVPNDEDANGCVELRDVSLVKTTVLMSRTVDLLADVRANA